MNHRRTFLLVTMVILLIATARSAGAARILMADDVPTEAAEALAGELNVLGAVSQGIALSLAACQGRPACQPNVSEQELSRLIETLDARIANLESQSDKPEAGELLQGYRQARQQYALYRQELEDLGQSAERDMKAEQSRQTQSGRADANADKPATRTTSSASATTTERAEPRFRNEAYEIDDFADVDELIRSD